MDLENITRLASSSNTSKEILKIKNIKVFEVGVDRSEALLNPVLKPLTHFRSDDDTLSLRVVKLHLPFNIYSPEFARSTDDNELRDNVFLLIDHVFAIKLCIETQPIRSTKQYTFLFPCNEKEFVPVQYRHTSPTHQQSGFVAPIFMSSNVKMKRFMYRIEFSESTTWADLEKFESILQQFCNYIPSIPECKTDFGDSAEFSQWSDESSLYGHSKEWFGHDKQMFRGIICENAISGLTVVKMI
ncbi:hypothetical protein HK096_011481 [Nowakowskiella sp. JEL0078]|nr:hypothetical protein HK096_011481 [Nowakowskiella sp. JEL0078]